MPVVVGFAPTGEGRAAIRRAAREALARRTDLVVVTPAGLRHEESGGRLDAELDTIQADLGGQGVAVHRPEPARSGDMADELLAVAERLDAELIVIGLRRRTAVGKLLLGSNAQRILLDSRTPVLAVKADPADR